MNSKWFLVKACPNYCMGHTNTKNDSFYNFYEKFYLPLQRLLGQLVTDSEQESLASVFHEDRNDWGGSRSPSHAWEVTANSLPCL